MTFRIYKGYTGTKCVRNFDSLEDAQTWCIVRDRKETYRIEWVEPADERHGIRERKCRIFV